MSLPSTHLLIGELAGALVEVDVGLLDDDVGVAPTHTLHGGQSVHHLGLTVNVGVHDTQNVLELGGYNERLKQTHQAWVSSRAAYDDAVETGEGDKKDGEGPTDAASSNTTMRKGGANCSSTSDVVEIFCCHREQMVGNLGGKDCERCTAPAAASAL